MAFKRVLAKPQICRVLRRSRRQTMIRLVISIFGYSGGAFRQRHCIVFRKRLGDEQYNPHSFWNQSGFMFGHVYSLYPLGIRQQTGSQKVRIDPILPQPY